MSNERSRLLSPFHKNFKAKHSLKNSSYIAIEEREEDDNNNHAEVGFEDDPDGPGSTVTREHNSGEQDMSSEERSAPSIKEEKAVIEKKRMPALGIIMALMSVLCYSLGAAIVNLLPELHSIEILVIRSLFQFIAFTFVTLCQGYPMAPVKGHRVDLLLRCISGTITLTTVFVAYRLMPLADASTIQFSSPVFVGIFAYFMLREPMTALELIAGAITLTGVVVIAQPEFIFGAQTNTIYDSRLLGTVLAVVSSISGGFSMITLRKLKTTPVAVIVMWYSLLVMIVGIAILLVLKALVWPQGWYTWALLSAVGVCGIGDQYFVSKAMQFETPGPVSVTRTATIAMTFVWEAILLGQPTGYLSVLGASLITGCVLMLAIEKWRKQSPQTFEKLYNCCPMSDDFYDREEFDTKSNFSDSYNSYYDSIDYHKKCSNQLYFNQFILMDGTDDEYHSEYHYIEKNRKYNDNNNEDKN